MNLEVKDLIISAIAREIAVIVPLGKQVKREDLSFRLFKGGRTIEETMRYLTWCSVSITKYYLDNETSLQQAYTHYQKKYESYPIEEFIPVMYKQFKEIRLLFTEVTDEDLKYKQVDTAWKETMPLGEAILQTTLKYLTAYRMQLFLMLKAAGHNDLNTLDCWIGELQLDSSAN